MKVLKDGCDEVQLVTSSKSMRVVIGGFPFSINVFRLEHEESWTLEVVDLYGTSHLWDEQFESEKNARDAALHKLETEEPVDFVRGSNIVPFAKD